MSHAKTTRRTNTHTPRPQPHHTTPQQKVSITGKCPTPNTHPSLSRRVLFSFPISPVIAIV